MLQWRARFSGQHVLNQFNGNKEILFREVLNRAEDLELFELIGDGKIYQVNLKTGEFFINGISLFPITEKELGIPLRDIQYRIIYYKRMMVKFTSQQINASQFQSYLLGWQTTANGRNIQRIMQIFPDGKIFLQMNK